MALKNATDVAKRSLCLELLLQRLGLELDEEDPVAERDAVRRAWLSRLGQLGLEEAIHPDERALLDRPVGDLTDDECDDIEGRVIGALVLLWTLLRLGARPTAASLGIATRLIAEHGVLGDGSIPEAKALIEKLTLRPDAELREGLSAYALAHESGVPTDPDPMVAVIGVRTLDWVLGEA